MNASVYHDLAGALRERLFVISDDASRNQNPEAHLERLKTISEKIAALQSQLPDPVHPQLRHFLERCSYDKALAMIEAMLPKR